MQQIIYFLPLLHLRLHHQLHLHLQLHLLHQAVGQGQILKDLKHVSLEI